MDYDFGLEDRFCDAQDLKNALIGMNIPEPIVRFFGYLYNFNPETYQKAAEAVMSEEKRAVDGGEEDDCDEDVVDEEVPSVDGNLSTKRCWKVQSLFQILYYVHHCGRKRTLMHIMNAESVHSLGRGGRLSLKVLITRVFC